MKRLLSALMVAGVMVANTALPSSAQEAQSCFFTFEGETYYGTRLDNLCESTIFFGSWLKHADRNYVKYIDIAINAGRYSDWNTAIINAKKALAIYSDEYSAKRVLLAATRAKQIDQKKITITSGGQQVNSYQLWGMLTGMFAQED